MICGKFVIVATGNQYTREDLKSPKILSLADLETLCKQEVKATVEL